MKIDIGSGGKIIGTKRVSANGQVSGLTEYAGKEVLIILPSPGVEVSYGAEDLFGEFRRIAEEYMRLAFQQYKELQKVYSTPRDATIAFLKSMTPSTYHAILDQIDNWIKKQTNTAETVMGLRKSEELAGKRSERRREKRYEKNIKNTLRTSSQ